MSSRYKNIDPEAEEWLVGSSSAVRQEEIKLQIENSNEIAETEETNIVETNENDTELARCEIYEAAAKGDIDWLRSHDRSEIESFETRGEKNTIIHIYIIAQSLMKLKENSFSYKLKLTLEVLYGNFRQKFCNATSATPLSVFQTAVSILSEYPLLLWKVNKAGDSPLHMAARHGNELIADALIKCVAGVDDVWTMLHSDNADKETALHEAVRYQHQKVVHLLIRADDSKFRYSANKYGETPLYMAAERGNGNLVKMILSNYESPAYEGPDGRTALHAAALHCDSTEECRDIVTILGMKLTTKKDDQGRTPLHYNENLLSFDTSAAFIADNFGKTALHIAASKGYAKSVEEFIIKCPECFELVDNKGRNALHYAVESGNDKVVDAILKSEYLGDLVKKKDNDGSTPLHLLATFRIYLPKLIKDPRFDKLGFNNAHLTPLDIILSNPTPSKKKLENHMHKAGLDQGKRVVIKPRSNNVEKTEIATGKLDSHRKHDIDEELKEARQNHLVVVALIATITFAAGFTLPGGYIQADGPHLGYAVFTKKTAFQAFVITDTLAMVLSCAAVFIHLLIAMHKEKIINMNTIKEKMIAMDKGREITKTVNAMNERKKMVSDLFNKALPLTLIAIVAMVFAFITGTYAVLSIYPPLAIAATVTGCFFFGLFWYLWEELFNASQILLAWLLLAVWFVAAIIGICIILVPILLYSCAVHIKWRLWKVAKNQETKVAEQPK